MAQARVIDPAGYQRLVDAVVKELCRYVLVNCSRLAGSSDPFLYELPAGVDPRGQGSVRMFAGGLQFAPGVVDVDAFEPLLRPLIQQRWAQHVAGLRTNAIVRQAYELEVFLFGAERLVLGPVTEELRDLQAGRCFSCRDQSLATSSTSTISSPGRATAITASTIWSTPTAAVTAASPRTWRDLTTSRSGAGGFVQAILSRLISRTSRCACAGSASQVGPGEARAAYLYATPATLFWDNARGLHREAVDALRRAMIAA